MCDDLRFEFPKNKIDIRDLKKYFVLEKAIIRNIGHAFYNQLIITMSVPLVQKVNSAEKIEKYTSINFIFDQAKNIELSQQFICSNNAIDEVILDKIADDMIKIIFVFSSNEGKIKFSFQAKEVEWNFLNPYMN